MTFSDNRMQIFISCNIVFPFPLSRAKRKQANLSVIQASMSEYYSG